MDMVKLVILTAAAATSAMASDFSIEIGSPVAALSEQKTKVKNAAFSVRAKDCPTAQFSGVAHWESSRKQILDSLVFTPGTTAGSYAVSRNAQAYGAYVAVITADCAGTKMGALVPVSADGVYNRSAAKFVSHAPTPAEMEEALRAMQGASK